MFCKLLLISGFKSSTKDINFTTLENQSILCLPRIEPKDEINTDFSVSPSKRFLTAAEKKEYGDIGK